MAVENLFHELLFNIFPYVRQGQTGDLNMDSRLVMAAVFTGMIRVESMKYGLTIASEKARNFLGSNCRQKYDIDFIQEILKDSEYIIYNYSK